MAGELRAAATRSAEPSALLSLWQLLLPLPLFPVLFRVSPFGLATC